MTAPQQPGPDEQPREPAVGAEQPYGAAGAPPQPSAPSPPPPPNRLYRSRTDRILGGVAAGVAEVLNLDPSLVRVAWLLLAIFTGGLFGLVYLVMWIIVPEAPEGAASPAAPPSRDAMPGWQPPPPPSAPPGQQYVHPAQGEASPGASAMVAGVAAQAGEPPSGAAPSGATATEPEPGPATAPTDAAGWQPPADEGAQPRPAGAGAPGMNTASIVIGLILIVIGGIFLLEQLVPQFDVGAFWPLVPIVIGGALLYTALRPRPGG